MHFAAGMINLAAFPRYPLSQEHNMKSIVTLMVTIMVAPFCLAQEPHRLAPVNSPSVNVSFENIQVTPGTVQKVPALVEQPCKNTVCVTEPKKNTKIVYSSVCKEYCVQHCSLLSWFGGECGCGDACEKRTRNVLVKKKIPACDTTQCVLKEIPAASSVPLSK